MSDSRNNPQETFFLFVVLLIGAIVVIATYFIQIVLFVGAALLGTGLGFLLSRALGHMGKRWGYVGVLELIFLAVGFRFLFGIPFAFDSWRGVECGHKTVDCMPYKLSSKRLANSGSV